MCLKIPGCQKTIGDGCPGTEAAVKAVFFWNSVIFFGVGGELLCVEIVILSTKSY